MESIFGKNVTKDYIKGNQIGNYPVITYNIPLKENKTIELFVINFMVFLSKDQIIKGINYLIEPKKN